MRVTAMRGIYRSRVKTIRVLNINIKYKSEI